MPLSGTRATAETTAGLDSRIKTANAVLRPALDGLEDYVTSGVQTAVPSSVFGHLAGRKLVVLLMVLID